MLSETCKDDWKKESSVFVKNFLQGETAQNAPSKGLPLLQVSASCLLRRTILIFSAATGRNFILAAAVLERTVDLWSWKQPGVEWAECDVVRVGAEGWSHLFPAVWLSGCCYGFKPQSALTVSEPQSCSQAEGLASKGWGVVEVLWGGGECCGGVTQASLVQVLRLKGDSHLWCGRVQSGCLDACEGTFMVHTRAVNSV